MKILFLPKYNIEGPSSRYRIYNYINYFVNAGHDVTVKPLLYDGYVKSLFEGIRSEKVKLIRSILSRIIYMLLYRKNYDILIIEKELLTNAPYFIERLLLKGCKYIVDYDDAISINYKMHPIKRIFLKNKINYLNKRAILTTVGNRWYWNEITGRKLMYLPTVIDIDAYMLSKNKLEKSVPVIVWIGNPGTVRYLKKLEPVLKRLAEEQKFILRVIGAKIEIDGIETELVQWSKEKEFEYLYNSDIGIMPLDKTLWENGKCGFKLIQYMAAGLATIASPAPANYEITAIGETGFIANNDEEWLVYLSKLIKDKTLRQEMGIKSRKRVESNYTYQVWGNKFVKLVDDEVRVSQLKEN